MRNLKENIMGNYASAYEEYYKNLNNKSRDNETKKSSPFKNRSNNNFMIDSDRGSKYFSKSYWETKVKRQLAGSLVLISFFAALKYSGVENVNKYYSFCKQSILMPFNYDESIEAFNSVEIGTFKIRDIRIGQFKVEDLKHENLKKGIENFKEYLNQVRGESMEI